VRVAVKPTALLIAFSLSACVGVRSTPNAAVTAPASLAVRERTRTPLATKKHPCPLTPKSKGAPACFKPIDVQHPALLRAEKTTCRYATTTPFVGVRPALSLLVNVVEGSTGFSIPFLREGDGATHLVPEGVTNAMWSDEQVVGLASDGHQLGFWKNGVCEVPPDGSLSSLSPLSDGRFVALWTREDRTVETLERAVDGSWSTWGPTLQAHTERLVGQGGRVALTFDTTTSSPQRDFGTEHPDLGRTRVLGRLLEQPAYSEFIRHGAWVPLPASSGATFSSAVAVADGSLGGPPTLFVPRGEGSVAVPLASLTEQRARAKDCPKAGPSGELKTGPWASVSSAGAWWWEPGVLLAHLESRGECLSRVVQPPPRNCPPGAPCAPPEGPRTELRRTQHSLNLVLENAGERSGPLVELALPTQAEDDANRWVGVSIATTDREVLVAAEGYFLVFDRRKLEELAR
jgi:hypothetical protein